MIPALTEMEVSAMSNPTTPDHPFVSPGQVAPHLPAPDNCVRCGQPRAAHTGPVVVASPAPSTYMEEAALQDSYLDEKLAAIRRREAAGELTVREAAAERVEALQHHVQAVRYLRREHFGEQS